MTSEEQPEQPAATVRAEVYRQLFALGFALAGLVVLSVAERHASDPDFARTAGMAAAKRLERAHAQLAAWSWRRAESWRRAYEAGRP